MAVLAMRMYGENQTRASKKSQGWIFDWMINLSVCEDKGAGV